MSKKNKKETPLYENDSFNDIYNQGFGDFERALYQTYIKKEQFERGVRWLYEEVLHLSNPHVIYCNDIHLAKKIDRHSDKISAKNIENALWQQIYYPLSIPLEQFKKRRDNDSKAYRLFCKTKYKSHKRFHDDHILGQKSPWSLTAGFIHAIRKNGINIKIHSYDTFCLNTHIQVGTFLFPDLPYLKSLFYSGVCHAFFWKDIVLALPMPTVRQDELNLLHSTVYPAIEWPGGIKSYYIHGREIPESVFTYYGTPELRTKFLTENNEDIRAGIVTLVKEREGNEGLLNFLEAEIVDEKEISHFVGYSEVIRLYKTKEKYNFLQNRKGEFGQPYCWSEFLCPSTGTPYLIDNSADFTDAIEAAKFLRPSFIATELP